MTDALLLVIDTATSTPLVALVGPDGTLQGQRQWASRHRHGEQLLPELDLLLTEMSAQPGDLAGVIAGTGPGSFTGLRIGLATAKVIAYSLDLPLVGVSTTLAMAHAVGGGRVAVTLPAGAIDRYVHVVADGEEPGLPQLVAPGEAFSAAVAGARLVAVDLAAEDIPPEASQLGRDAVAALGAALGAIGVRGLAAGSASDPADLVPAYVALPRGIAAAVANMQWSPDLR